MTSITYRGVTFTISTDTSGNVVEIDIPGIGNVPPTTIAYNPSVVPDTAIAIAKGIINAILGPEGG